MPQWYIQTLKLNIQIEYSNIIIECLNIRVAYLNSMMACLNNTIAYLNVIT